MNLKIHLLSKIYNRFYETKKNFYVTDRKDKYSVTFHQFGLRVTHESRGRLQYGPYLPKGVVYIK